MASFVADIRQWHTVAQFNEHLLAFPDRDYAWIEKLVIHHTVKPLPNKWNGRRTMDELLVYYRDTKHWTAGPHLFICIGSIIPDNDGIWQLTPMNTPGIHAGDCNHNGLGIEIVGNYDLGPWPIPLKNMVYGALLALLRRCRIGPCDVYGHRECGSLKTCPGKAIDMRTVRIELADLFTLW